MPLPVQPGALIADKYRVTGVIGEGGMGVVMAAEHTQLHRLVAIKFLHANASPTVAERFAREARIAVRLQNEHVCKVHDVGQLPSGEPYMVMEHLEGQDLAQAVATHGPPQVQAAVDYLLQACEALAEAHVLGVVHRDLKPSNLFITQRMDGSVCIKVLDFGISKMDSSGSVGAPQLTLAGSVLGSPRFISPEQLANTGDVDLRSDLWSLGAVLHELLSGQAAFAADTVGELLFVILNDDPTPLSQLRPDVPPGLAAVVSRCLTKDPTQRYQNVAELALALQPFGSGNESVSVQRAVAVYAARGWTPPAELDRASVRAPHSVQSETGAHSMAGQAAAVATPVAVTTATKSGRGAWLAVGVVVGALTLAGVVVGGMSLRSSDSDSAKSDRSKARRKSSETSPADSVAERKSAEPKPMESKSAAPKAVTPEPEGPAFWCYRMTELPPMSFCAKTKDACELSRGDDAKKQPVSACAEHTSVSCVTWSQDNLALEMCFVSAESCAAFRNFVSTEPTYKDMSACGPAT